MTPPTCKRHTTEKNLTKMLGRLLREFIRREKRINKISKKQFAAILSKKLFDEFGVTNSEPTVTRNLQRICACQIAFSEDYRQCLESVFQAPIPTPIRNFLQGKPPIPTLWNAARVSEELQRFSPTQFVSKLRSGQQKEAAREEYARHLGALRRIEQGQIPLRLDTAAYFNRFFDFVSTGNHTKKVQVFARLLNLEARKNLLKFGPKGLQHRFVEAVRAGQLDAEYVIFLRSPESLKLPEVKETLKFYRSFASRIYLHYQTKTPLSNGETGQTIAIWDEYGAIFTHDWDYRGNLENLVQWVCKEDHERLRQSYETIRSQSDLYPDP
jgi:hypothetical protein